MLKHSIRATALAAVFASGSAVAQKPAPPNYNVGDPNERICENLTIVGSRLAVKRVCARRAEWADRIRQDREAIESAQRSPCVMTHNVRGANGNGSQSC